MIIHISKTETNATPVVIDALAKIKAAGGGKLHFEKGEYHFYKEGTYKKFFAVSNNSACDKYMVFPIIDFENLHINGSGSVFVFHDVVFPFMVSHSKNVAIENIICDTGVSPLVEFTVGEKTEQGFYLDIDRNKSPFFVDKGSLCFQRESGVVSGKEELYPLHALGHHKVQFFATGACRADRSNLPVTCLSCDITETERGIFAAYREDTQGHCEFERGEKVISIVDGKRYVDLFCLDRSEQVLLRNITVRRGIGMGVVGQLSRDIEIDGFSTDISYHNGYQTLTADSLHFINCDGRMEIHNCTISDTMDDVLNVHGMYTRLKGVEPDKLVSRIMHQEQTFFHPYRPGDRLSLVDGESFDIVAEFVVESAAFCDEKGREVEINGKFTYGEERAKEGLLLENPRRMPDLHLHHNHFYNFPHVRISGAGEILVEDNHITDCNCALLCMDLARYWYESGRVSHLVYRNNVLDRCNGRGGRAFLNIGIDGVPNDQAPKIHGRVEIIGNHFTNIRQYAVKAGGVQQLVIEDNVIESERDDLFCIDQPK